MDVEGEVRIPWKGQDTSAVLGEEGWRCDDAGLLALLNAAHAPQPSAAGNPYARALHGAAHALNGTVVREWPVEDEPGRVY